MISQNTVPSININDETGDGSKEVVTDFNFPDADIMDIAKTLGKLTGKNFILDKDVKGRITIISNCPITVGDAWKAFPHRSRHQRLRADPLGQVHPHRPPARRARQAAQDLHGRLSRLTPMR